MDYSLYYELRLACCINDFFHVKSIFLKRWENFYRHSACVAISGLLCDRSFADFVIYLTIHPLMNSRPFPGPLISLGRPDSSPPPLQSPPAGLSSPVVGFVFPGRSVNLTALCKWPPAPPTLHRHLRHLFCVARSCVRAFHARPSSDLAHAVSAGMPPAPISLTRPKHLPSITLSKATQKDVVPPWQFSSFCLMSLPLKFST